MSVTTPHEHHAEEYNRKNRIYEAGPVICTMAQMLAVHEIQSRYCSRQSGAIWYDLQSKVYLCSILVLIGR
jgi:hypothetical protein